MKYVDIHLRNTLLITIWILLISTSAIGQNIVVKPYLQDLGENSVVVMWETGSNGLGSVFFGTDPFDMNTEIPSISVVGNGTSRIHTSTLTPLVPNQKYYYQVEMADGTKSRLYSFKTQNLQADEKNVQLIAISDMQRDGSKPDKFREIVEEGIIPIVFSEIGDSLYDLEAVLIPGDLVVTGGNYSQWKDHFFSKSDSLTPYLPLYPVPGNHEYFGGGLPNFKKYFHLPDNGLGQLEDECWYKDISNVRIIGLNSNSGSSDQNIQLDWLSETLDSTCSNDNIDFVFAELHHPYKSELWTPGENGFTGKVVDSLESFTELCGKASIHFFGHTHGYSRGQSRDHKHLWINVATAGGAIDNWGEFPNADYAEFVKSQDEYGFVLIDVEAGDDPMFTIKRYSRGDQDVIVDNVVRDSITILNSDIAPKTPVNAFPQGDTILSYCIVLKASVFEGEEDIHQASHWQISSTDNFDGNLLAEKWAQNENFYNEINQQAGDDLTDEVFSAIDASDTLYWRVRYRNQNLTWSSWSLPTTFFLSGSVDTVSSNLVLNGDAENGINHWTGDVEALFQGECNSILPYEGDYNFSVGGICQDESPSGIAIQEIDLTAFETEINNNKLSLSLSSFMRNYSGSDVPEMYVELYENGTFIEKSATISNATPNWIKKMIVMAVPEAVDSMVVVLEGTRTAGTDNDSYFDEIEVYLLDLEDCPSCYGTSSVDSDMDGYCDDIDCSDDDPLIYPGAIELCNEIDDNCDGLADFGDSVSWTGNAGTNHWGDAMNWDQEMVPLPCQHVIIDLNSSVLLNGTYECYSIMIGLNNQLQIGNEDTLVVNSKNNNTESSVSIDGTLVINGRFDLKNSQEKGIEVKGILINNNRLNVSEINMGHISLKNGGRFDSLGKTVLK